MYLPEWNDDQRVEDEQDDEDIPVHPELAQWVDQDLPPFDLQG